VLLYPSTLSLSPASLPHFSLPPLCQVDIYGVATVASLPPLSPISHAPLSRLSLPPLCQVDIYGVATVLGLTMVMMVTPLTKSKTEQDAEDAARIMNQPPADVPEVKFRFLHADTGSSYFQRQALEEVWRESGWREKIGGLEI